jgi:hypothetical protein
MDGEILDMARSLSNFGRIKHKSIYYSVLKAYSNKNDTSDLDKIKYLQEGRLLY